MSPPDILAVCVSAFVAIFTLLTVLAGLMRLLVWAFPATVEEPDTAIYAAVAAACRQVFPHSRISEIKEEK